jgi:hypothetical protein
MNLSRSTPFETASKVTTVPTAPGSDALWIAAQDAMPIVYGLTAGVKF